MRYMVIARLSAEVTIFFFSSRRRHTRFDCDWSSDVCSSDLQGDADSLAARVHRLADAYVAGYFERHPDRKSVVEGKRGDLGGRRILKKKKKKQIWGNSL